MTLTKESTKLIPQPAVPETRTINADIHNHLRTGADMTGLLKPLLSRAEKRLGRGGIVGIIDFENYGEHSRYLQLLKQAGDNALDLGSAFYVPEKDILVVKGQEVPTREGHLLVLGLEKQKHLSPNKDLMYSVYEAEDNNGIIIADHPFYLAGIGPYLTKHLKYLEHIDAIEGYNGEAALWMPYLTPEEANKEALRFYNFVCNNYKDFGFISASDGHSLYELGRSYTQLTLPEFAELKNSEDVNNALRPAIRKAKPEDCVMKPARLGTLSHIFNLAASAALRKLGFQSP